MNGKIYRIVKPKPAKKTTDTYIINPARYYLPYNVWYISVLKNGNTCFGITNKNRLYAENLAAKYVKGFQVINNDKQ